MRRALTALMVSVFASSTLVTILAGCGASATANSTNLGASDRAVLATRDVTVNGARMTVLTDARGMTLYYFVSDSDTQIACTGSCARNWPPLLQPSGTPKSATQLSGTLSTLDGPNGRQVLYNGHPLYLYVRDKAPGDTTGEGVNGKWHVATPNLPLQGGSTSPGYNY